MGIEIAPHLEPGRAVRFGIVALTPILLLEL